MDAAGIAAIIAAFGGLRGVEAIITAAWKSWPAKGQKRRGELDRAFAYGDREAKKRRIAERHAGLLERMLIAAQCVDPKDIPAWPSYGADTGPTDLEKNE